jgi:hypothetical protein
VPEAEREILSFGDQPRWFCSVGDKHPPPKALAQLPLTERGARLRFEAQKADEPSVLVFRLTLTATDRLLVREVEHRWTNTLPFLFALYAEGRAIRPSQEDSGFSKFGGMANLTLLVPKGEQKTWSVRVDGESLLKALPQRGPQTVSLVAAFGERQHSPMGLMGGDRFGMADALAAEFDGVTTEPPIVIRSSPVHLRWSGKDWFVTGEPGRASGGPLQAEPEAGKAKAPHAR